MFNILIDILEYAPGIRKVVSIDDDKPQIYVEFNPFLPCQMCVFI